MLGMFARQLGFDDGNLGGAKMKFRVPGRGDPGGDLLTRGLGLPDLLFGEFKTLLIGDDLDESCRGTTGNIDPGSFRQSLLLVDFGIAQRLTRGPLAAQFDCTAKAQRGFGRFAAAERSRTRNIVEIARYDILRGHALALGARPDGTQFSGFRHQQGIGRQGAGDRFLKTQGFGGASRRDCTASPGQGQDQQTTQIHREPPIDRQTAVLMPLSSGWMRQAIGGRNGEVSTCGRDEARSACGNLDAGGASGD